MTKVGLRAAAAMALAMLATSPVIAAKLRLPPPRAPEQKIYSPMAIAGELQKRGYRIESMKREGTAYSVRAVGPHKNKVQLMVDGRSGEIVGLAVLEAAPDLVTLIAQAILGGKNTRYVDDRHPFGIIVPEIYQTNWVVIPTWTVTAGSPRYVEARASGRGYRYAVPYSTIRPGRGGRSRSTMAPARLQTPLYDVYEANGAQLETVSYTEDTTIITEVTSEETTYSEEYSMMEESYLGGEVAEDTTVEVADFDAEDGDLSFADDSSDTYDAEVDEADFADYSDEGAEADEAADAVDESDDSIEADASQEGDALEEGDAETDLDDSGDEGEDATEDSDEADSTEDLTDSSDEVEEPDDYDVSADEPEEPDDGWEDAGGDEEEADDGGEDYDSGDEEEPEGSVA